MKVLIRADASDAIGVGHVMRCLTLAQQLQLAGAQITFACRALPGHIFARVLAQGYSLIELSGQYPDAAAQASTLNWQADFAELHAQLVGGNDVYDFLIVDHYELDWRWEKAMRQHTQCIMVIDDLCNRRHDAEILLDQNLSANAGAYQAWLEPHCQMLLGPKYALLRPEFAGDAISINPEIKRILVNFGGADPTREMFKVMDALQDLVGYEVDFVAGASNPAVAQLAERISGQLRWHLHTHVEDFAALMRQVDLFIGAAGSTSWERAALGLPSICIAVADNQRANGESLAKLGAHHYLGVSGEVSALQIRDGLLSVKLPTRLQWSQVSKQLADGYGTRRVVANMLRNRLTIRRGLFLDAKTLFDARNAPQVRQQSLQSSPLQWEAHCAWLLTRLEDTDCLLLIGELFKQIIGVVRFERIHSDLAEISIYLLPEHFNLGWGRYLLAQCQIEMQSHWPDVCRIRAVIKDENHASVKLFTGAGYQKQASHYICTLRESMS